MTAGLLFAIWAAFVLGVLLGHWLTARSMERTVREAFTPLIQAAMGTRHLNDELNEALLGVEMHPLIGITAKGDDE